MVCTAGNVEGFANIRDSGGAEAYAWLVTFVVADEGWVLQLVGSKADAELPAVYLPPHKELAVCRDGGRVVGTAVEDCNSLAAEAGDLHRIW